MKSQKVIYKKPSHQCKYKEWTLIKYDPHADQK